MMGALATDRLDARGARLGLVGLVVGLAALGGALALGHAQDDGWRRLQHAWLVSCVFFLSLSLGGLFFVIIQHLTRAGWSVVVRRVAELVAANTPVVALLFAPLVVRVVMGDAGLYPWADPEHVHAHPALAAKAAFLDGRFFAARCVLYFGVWILLGRWLLARSLEQDASADAAPTLALERRAALCMVLFALSVNFAAFDLLMSLDPAWYSTIFGVYVFAGSVAAFFAFAVLALRWLQRGGKLPGVGVEHYHDLGKFLFAFVAFWGYIAFSQFMLIWYADLPEETVWYQHRMHGTWTWASLALLFGHFIVPFFGLISRHAKRRLAALTFWALWMLAFHALDLWWIVVPGAEPGGANVLLLDGLCFLAVGGIWTFTLTRRAASCALVPVNDPRLPESLAFENI